MLSCYEGNELHRSLHGAGPLEYSNRQVIDLQALNTFNSAVSPLLPRAGNQGRNAPRNEASLPESPSSSPLSVFSSHRSSLGRPPLIVESRRSSGQELAMNRRPTSDIVQLARREITPSQVERGLHLLHESASEVQSATTNRANYTGSHGIKEEAIEGFAEGEHSLIGASSQRRPGLAQPAPSITDFQTTIVSSLIMPERRHSSDESQGTNGTMSSTVNCKTTPGSTVHRSCSADSEGAFSDEYQCPPITWNMARSQQGQSLAGSACMVGCCDSGISNQHHWVVDTPMRLGNENATRDPAGAGYR